MVGLAFTFPLGRYHATAWGTNVNEAAVDWPPSPWRMLRALLAAGRDGADRVALDAALGRLVAAGDPVYELPPANAGHTRHYVPLTNFEKDAPPKTSLIIDAFVALDPSREVRVFWDTELVQAERSALAQATHSLGYLGRSESVCEARLLPPGAVPLAVTAWPEEREVAGAPPATGAATLMGVSAGVSSPIAVLETDVGVMRKAMRLIPDGTRRVRYATAFEEPHARRAPNLPDDSPTTVVLRIAGNAFPEASRSVIVTALLRSALQRRFDRDGSGRRSPTLSGHEDGAPSARQHRHAHYLALADATGARVDRLAVWAPGGLDAAELLAIASLEVIRLRDMPEPLRVTLVAAGTADQALNGYVAASRCWESVTPMVLPRHVKPGRARDAPAEQIVAELSHRGFPVPTDIEVIEGPWGRFARDRPGQQRQRTKLAVGFRLRFSEPVAGPVILGANSHFGLGLMRPVA